MQICTDSLNIVFSFLDKYDFINLLSVNKYYSSFGDVLRKKVFPLLDTEDNPFRITEREVKERIKKFPFLRGGYTMRIENRNGQIDHIPRALSVSIAKRMIMVDKWRELKVKFRNLGMDWQIGVNILIEDFLAETENDGKELKKYMFNDPRFYMLN